MRHKNGNSTHIYFRKKTPAVSPGNYSPVTVYMEDTLGVIFLGILAVILLIGWRRAEMRYRTLEKQLEQIEESFGVL